MNKEKHWAIFTTNQSNKKYLINLFLNETYPKGFEHLKELKGLLFSSSEIDKYLDLEERLEEKIITKDSSQSLKSMSSGERKKALLKHLLRSNPDYLILDNPFDNLDQTSTNELKEKLHVVSKNTNIIQIISRKEDLLPFITNFVYLKDSTLTFEKDIKENNTQFFIGTIPKAIINKSTYEGEVLISLKNISVSYEDKPILKDINWEIKTGEFWQLIGKNGSGKTTILSMIIGENSKGYGQELFLFGTKKGSGESIWDIKQKVGYFTPAMVDKFSGRHSAKNMVISGLNDSVGLYIEPTETQLQLAKEWLQLISMWELRDVHFRELSIGQQRMVMVVRAMIKHPSILILDEPTTGLDDKSASLFVALVNKLAQESNIAILFVSHRKEEGLKPDSIYELKMTPEGSVGTIISTKSKY